MKLGPESSTTTAEGPLQCLGCLPWEIADLQDDTTTEVETTPTATMFQEQRALLQVNWSACC